MAIAPALALLPRAIRRDRLPQTAADPNPKTEWPLHPAHGQALRAMVPWHSERTEAATAGVPRSIGLARFVAASPAQAIQPRQAKQESLPRPEGRPCDPGRATPPAAFPDAGHASLRPGREYPQGHGCARGRPKRAIGASRSSGAPQRCVSQSGRWLVETSAAAQTPPAQQPRTRPTQSSLQSAGRRAFFATTRREFVRKSARPTFAVTRRRVHRVLRKSACDTCGASE